VKLNRGRKQVAEPLEQRAWFRGLRHVLVYVVAGPPVGMATASIVTAASATADWLFYLIVGVALMPAAYVVGFAPALATGLVSLSYRELPWPAQVALSAGVGLATSAAAYPVVTGQDPLSPAAATFLAAGFVAGAVCAGVTTRVRRRAALSSPS
jgi:hypothetical protein